MTATFVLLFYLCTPPAEGHVIMACRAREIVAPTCAQAIGIAEASIVPGHVMFVAACVAATGVPPQPAPARPRPQR